MNPHLTVDEVDHDGSATVLSVKGEIDIATAPELEERLRAATGDGTLVVDLTEVAFIDSTGLRALLTANEAASDAGSKLVLVVAEGPVTKLFDITGVDRIFEVADSRDAALADG